MAYLRSNRYQIELVQSVRVNGKPRTVVLHRFKVRKDLDQLQDSQFCREIEKKAGGKLDVADLLKRGRALGTLQDREPPAGPLRRPRRLQTTGIGSGTPLIREFETTLHAMKEWLSRQKDVSALQKKLKEVQAGKTKSEAFERHLKACGAPKLDLALIQTHLWEKAIGALSPLDARPPGIGTKTRQKAKRRAERPAQSIPSSTEALEPWLRRFLSVHYEEHFARKERGAEAPKPHFTRPQLRDFEREFYRPREGGETDTRFVGYLKTVRKIETPTLAHLEGEWMGTYEAHLRKTFTRGPHLARQGIRRARTAYGAFLKWIKLQGIKKSL